jgi:hypothetical protein
MNNWPFVWLQGKRKIRVHVWVRKQIVWCYLEISCGWGGLRARLGELTSGWRLGEKQSHWPWHEFWQAPKPHFWWSLGLVVRRHGYFWHCLELKVVELTQWQGLARFHRQEQESPGSIECNTRLSIDSVDIRYVGVMVVHHEQLLCCQSLKPKKKRLIRKTFKRDFDL